MDERHRLSADAHARDRHALAACGGNQIEEDLRHAGRQLQRHRRFARDLVVGIVERKTEDVVNGVDTRLSRIGVRVRRMCTNADE